MTCYARAVMVGGRCSCAISDRPIPSPTRKTPLSPLLPLDTSHSHVSPLFPLHTKNRGVPPSLRYDHFPLRAESSFRRFSLFATPHSPLSSVPFSVPNRLRPIPCPVYQFQPVPKKQGEGVGPSSPGNSLKCYFKCIYLFSKCRRADIPQPYGPTHKAGEKPQAWKA